MKLFHKFLIALIVVSTIPLIVYSYILLKTTGNTLKTVINRNSLSVAENMTREVNKYFAEVEPFLDIARKADKEKTLSTSSKFGLILGEMAQTKNLLGILLLNSNMDVASGMTEDGGTYGLVINKDLVKKSNDTHGVETGGIFHTAKDIPYFDISYPVSIQPREYFYFRVKIDFLLERMRRVIQNFEDRSEKQVILIDQEGNAVSTLGPIRSTDKDRYSSFKDSPLDTVFLKDGNVNIVSKSRGPGWLVVLSEPANTAYAPVNKLWIGAIVLIIITLSFSIFAALFLAKNLSSPITKLIAGIEIVASGNLDYKVQSVSSDELGKLVNIFNNMTVKIKDMQEEVKKTARLSSIGQMANILGHEIRNPLAAMTNSVFLIKRLITKMTDVNPIMEKSANIIESEIKSTSRIIDNMLDFSRTRPPVLSERNLPDVVNEIMQATKVPDTIELQLELTGTFKVMVDIEEIKQVVRNLVNNAIDAMHDKGTGTLRLQVYKAAMLKDGKNVTAACLNVMDTGSGMKPEVIKKIFEPFFSTKSKGTGLGLAVVQKIVEERHGGVIEVNSVVGKGTTFSVKLPLKTD